MVWTWSCNEEENFLPSDEVRLEFSLDTLRFDTVFTERGSATRAFRVINPSRRPARLERVFLEGGENSLFRLNIDGEAASDLSGVEVLGNDSIWIFAEVTVDPDQPPSVSPFVVEDKVRFQVGDTEEEVILEAWGQNANYFPSRFNAGVPVILTCDNQEVIWDDPKPYVIYGEVFLDSCLLSIAAGTRIHVHGGVARNEVFGTFNDGMLYVLKDGSLQVNGTAENPVIIQGDRLEESYSEEEGQWTGIILGKESRNNRLDFTTVKNSIFGVYVDSSATLLARNSQFYNTSGSGMIAFHAEVEAENCLFYNNYNTAVQLVNGGDYRFTYCTLASYGVNASAVAMTNFYCYDDPAQCNYLNINPLRVRVRNSILFGSNPDEIVLSDIYGGEEPGAFDIGISHSVVKVDELLNREDGRYDDFFETICTPCTNGTRSDPLFVDVSEENYHLDTLSLARGIGVPILDPSPVNIDLEARPRDPVSPDSGCYEYQE